MFIASAVVLAGCSGGGGGGDHDQVNAGDLVSKLPAAKGEVDVLKWNLPGEPETLDPANTVYYPSGTVVRNLCDSLITANPDFTLKPNLATFEVKSPTQIVYTINKDAKFWDGSPVTAEDVAYTLNRVRDPKYVLSFIMINVKSVDVTGVDEVTVNFATPDELFANEMQNIGIIQKAYTEKQGDKFGTAAGGVMCSGPYKLGKWSPGNSLTMTRNDDYWNKDVRPLAKTVKFSFIGDATALAQALDSGEIDGSYEVPASAIPVLKKSSAGRLVFGPSTQGVNINITTPDGVTADPQVRQAFQHALDRDAIAKVVYHGAATANFTAVTPATWPKAETDIYQAGYDEIAAARKYDLEAAKKLVEASDYDGTPIVMAVQAGDETISRVAQLVQQQAKSVGLTVEIRSLQPLVFTEAGYDATKRKGIDMMLQSNFNATADPLEPMGFTYLPGQPYNYTEFDNPAVTKLLTDARQSFDAKERAKMVVEAQVIIEQDASAIPVVSTNTTTFLNNRLTGAVTSFAYWSLASMTYIGSAN
ncbi:ABC transporter substrate-binding protein [Nocardioides ginsengisoli]